MNNIMVFLTPKKDVVTIFEDYTLRQALAKMEVHHYQTVPILSKEGKYVRVITEGDILWFIKNQNRFSLLLAEDIKIKDIATLRPFESCRVTAKFDEIVRISQKQNFIPVVDDDGIFIGIIRRQQVIAYLIEKSDSE